MTSKYSSSPRAKKSLSPSKKIVFTRQFLKEINLPDDDKSVREIIPVWWRDSRTDTGLWLTPTGYDTLKNRVGLQFYQIDLPGKGLSSMPITNKMLIALERFIDCPFFIDKRSIMVSSESMAIQLVLFGGDLNRFISAKENSSKNA